MPTLTQSLLFILVVSQTSTAFSGEPMLDAFEEAKRGITFTITSKPFDPKAHVIKKCGEAVCLIDGKPFFGTNGKMPQQEVTSLIFEWKGKRAVLDVSGMYDPGVDKANIQQKVTALSHGWGTYTVTGYFSNGDARYVGEWMIMKNTSSLRTHLSDFATFFALDDQVKKDFNYVSLESVMRGNANPKE